MDISNLDFQSHIHAILRAISLSRFVSLDLELSGIPSRHFNQARNVTGEYGKQTLQQRYAETKTAAEIYQVLQLGLTCVEEDMERGCYVLRTYNFNLQPVPDQTLLVERDITIQSSALDFLRLQGFHIEDCINGGVPYLSREEEVKARAMKTSRQDRYDQHTITVRPDDWDSQCFLDRVRRDVNDKFYQAREVCALSFQPKEAN